MLHIANSVSIYGGPPLPNTDLLEEQLVDEFESFWDVVVSTQIERGGWTDKVSNPCLEQKTKFNWHSTYNSPGSPVNIDVDRLTQKLKKCEVDIHSTLAPVYVRDVDTIRFAVEVCASRAPAGYDNIKTLKQIFGHTSVKLLGHQVSLEVSSGTNPPDQNYDWYHLF